MTPEQEYQQQIGFYLQKHAESMQVQALMHVEIAKLRAELEEAKKQKPAAKKTTAKAK